MRKCHSINPPQSSVLDLVPPRDPIHQTPNTIRTCEREIPSGSTRIKGIARSPPMKGPFRLLLLRPAVPGSSSSPRPTLWRARRPLPVSDDVQGPNSYQVCVRKRISYTMIFAIRIRSHILFFAVPSPLYDICRSRRYACRSRRYYVDVDVELTIFRYFLLWTLYGPGEKCPRRHKLHDTIHQDHDSPSPKTLLDLPLPKHTTFSTTFLSEAATATPMWPSVL